MRCYHIQQLASRDNYSRVKGIKRGPGGDGTSEVKALLR